MKTKIVRIRIQDSDFELIKKRGLTCEKNISETIRDLIHSGLENRTESNHISVPTIDPETVKKKVESAIIFGLEPALKAITLLRAEISELSKNPAPDPYRNVPGPAPEIRPEIVRFLAEKAARTDALLVEVASKITGKNVEVLRAEITEELGKSSAPDQGINGPEMIRFLAEKTARLDALLVEVSSKVSVQNVGDHSDRMKRAKLTAQSEIKNLFGG